MLLPSRYPQTFGNVWSHLYSSQLWGGGSDAELQRAEAEDAVRHPTMYRTGPQDRLREPGLSLLHTNLCLSHTDLCFLSAHWTAGTQAAISKQ